METRLPVEYPVQLSREEYVQAQELVTRAVSGNRGRGIGRLLPLMAALLCLLVPAVDYKLNGTPDISLIAMILIMVAVELSVFFSYPRIMRRRSESAYDTTRGTGYSFDGVVAVTDRDITKTTASAKTVIPFSECTYVEAADMMIFYSPRGKSIIVPARCVTDTDADRTRAAAMAGIPVNRRCLLKKMTGRRQEPLPAPDLTTPAVEEPLLTVQVEYTEKEFGSLAADAAWDMIPQLLPVKALLALCGAMLVFSWHETAALPVFILLLALFSLWPVFTARGKARKAVAITDGQALRLTVDLTESGVRVQGTGDHAKQMTLPWTGVTRAVECPEKVEFYAGKKALTIPKRCIPDMEALRRVTNSHMKP